MKTEKETVEEVDIVEIQQYKKTKVDMVKREQ